VGINIPTSKTDRVVLEVIEKEGTDRVYVIRDNNAAEKKDSRAKIEKSNRTGREI
jgi:hypothetical protein